MLKRILPSAPVARQEASHGVWRKHRFQPPQERVQQRPILLWFAQLASFRQPFHPVLRTSKSGVTLT